MSAFFDDLEIRDPAARDAWRHCERQLLVRELRQNVTTEVSALVSCAHRALFQPGAAVRCVGV